jgi:hypothetical protein
MAAIKAGLVGKGLPPVIFFGIVFVKRRKSDLSFGSQYIDD